MTWHADRDLLAGYSNGRLGRSQASSVEAHLMACADCREALGPMVDAGRVERNLAATIAVVDQPARGWHERLLVRVGVSDRVARLVAVVPGARNPWLTAVGLVLGVTALGAAFGGTGRTAYVFLVVAALFPVAAVAAVFATGDDPARELIGATPAAGLELLLARWVAVVVPAFVVAGLLSLAVPDVGWTAAALLLPSVCMATATMALASWLPVRLVAGVVAGVWSAAALWSARGVPPESLVERFVVFRPSGQVVLAVVWVVAGLVLLARRERFEVGQNMGGML